VVYEVWWRTLVQWLCGLQASYEDGFDQLITGTILSTAQPTTIAIKEIRKLAFNFSLYQLIVDLSR
jgi:hypothetical protein